MSDQVRAALAAIVEGRTLTRDEAHGAMGAVMDGEATPSQLAALLMGLRMRGETVDELAGFGSAMRERVLRVQAPAGTIDVVGTGGDNSGPFNIPTAAAPRIAEVAQVLGTERTLVVHGAGVDELPLDGSGVLYDVTPGGIAVRPVRAADLGLQVVATADLAGGTAADNAAILERVFA